MKKTAFTVYLLSALLLATSASADSTTSGLTSGGTIQTQDQIPIYRPSNPGTNFRVSVGSAATQSIGTSGPAVPLMSTANTWSALQSFLSGDLSAADPVFTGGSIQVPVGNTSVRPSSAINGMIRYNTDTPGIEAYVNGAWGAIGGSMVYPSAGISVSTGTAWGTSLAVGTAANDILQLNGSGQLPAVSAANLTNFPVLNQSTTGNAATATALAATPTPCSTGMAPTGILSNGNSTGCASISSGGSGITALTGDVTASGAGSAPATLATVNSNVGTFQGLTLNAKGLVTGATNQNYAPLAGATFTGPVSGTTTTWSGADTATNFTATGNGTNTLPVGTTAQRPTGANGMLRYNSTLAALEGYVNGAWATLDSGLVNLASQVTGTLQFANGGTGATTVTGAQTNLYGYPNFRAKLATIKKNSGHARACFAGDSTFFGAYSNNLATGDFITNSMPSQFSNALNNVYGIRANYSGFIGDGGIGATYGTDDPRVVIGGFAQDTTINSLGGATFKTTAVAGTPLVFTPTTTGDTFRFLYIMQSGGGSLSASIDGGTATTYSTAGTAGIGVATLVASSVGSHYISFTMSAGSQVNIIGVSDFYDSTHASVDVVNMGWPGATSTNWADTTAAYSPGTNTAWSALNCDLVFAEDGINDWSTGTVVALSTFTTNMQTWLSAIASVSTSDVIPVTPIPSPISLATQAFQQSYVDATYSVASSINLSAPLDEFQRWGTNVAAVNLDLIYPGSPRHASLAGYGEEGFSIASSVANVPGSPTTPLSANALGPFIAFGPSSTQATPAIAGDTTTGFYTPSAGRIVLESGGVQDLLCGASGVCTFGTTSTGAYVNYFSTTVFPIVISTSSTTGSGIQFQDTSTGGRTYAAYTTGSALDPGKFVIRDITEVSAPFSVYGGTSATVGQLVATNAGGTFCFSSTSVASDGCDTGLSRDSAGVIDVGTGAQGSTAGSMQMTNLTLSGKINFAAGRKGTFVCTAGGTISVSNTNEVAASDVVISLNTAGGTISTPPAIKTVTPGTGLSVLCGAADTSTYNYNIIN